MNLHRSKRFDLTNTPDLWIRLKPDIEIVQISLLFIELTFELICMIPKVNLGV